MLECWKIIIIPILTQIPSIIKPARTIIVQKNDAVAVKEHKLSRKVRRAPYTGAEVADAVCRTVKIQSIYLATPGLLFVRYGV